MRLDLNYGRDRYPLELRDDWDVTVIRKPAMPLAPDAAGAVREALAQPVGARDSATGSARVEIRLHPDLRYNAAGTQRTASAGNRPAIA
jgi:hypothetical protein